MIRLHMSMSMELEQPRRLTPEGLARIRAGLRDVDTWEAVVGRDLLNHIDAIEAELAALKDKQ